MDSNFNNKEDFSKKKQHKGKAIVLIFFILIAAFFSYKLLVILNDNFQNSADFTDLSDLNNISDNNNIAFIDFRTEYDSEQSIWFILGKDNEDNYYELADTQTSPYILGTYENKLFYSDEIELSYIDLSKTPYSKTTCITYINNTNDMNDFVTGYPDYPIGTIGEGFLIDDEIYFIDGVGASSYLY